MKHYLGISSILMLCGIILAGCQGSPLTTPSATSELSSGQIVALQYLTQEELLAQEVYTVLYDKRGTRQFGNILQSEDKHHQKMQAILRKYNINDLSDDGQAGVFHDPELQSLYTTLINQGSKNETEALAVGVAIETQDIADIEAMRDDFVNYPDIVTVLDQLHAGSKKHLAAFSK